MKNQVMKQRRPFAVSVLMFLLLFLGISAVFGGLVLVLDPTGELIQMPLALLEFSPFRDFLIPGLILGIVFGIGSFATVLALWFRPVWSFGAALTRFTGEHWSWSAAFAVGVGQVIWIVTQMLMLRGASWLHLVFGVLGLLIMLLTLGPGLRHYLADSACSPANRYPSLPD